MRYFPRSKGKKSKKRGGQIGFGGCREIHHFAYFCHFAPVNLKSWKSFFDQNLADSMPNICLYNDFYLRRNPGVLGWFLKIIPFSHDSDLETKNGCHDPGFDPRPKLYGPSGSQWGVVSGACASWPTQKFLCSDISNTLEICTLKCFLSQESRISCIIPATCI